ncbi:MAG: hypothetical protein IKG66_06520 [Lachnospiraceae bacterium]|nr:hypothetical protein [Lachnospiraceae bacterium]
MIRLKGIVARMMKVVRLVIAGFAAETARTTSSIETPMEAAYMGSVMQALQKQAQAIRITPLTERAVIRPFLLPEVRFMISHMGRMNMTAPIRLENSPT